MNHEWERGTTKSTPDNPPEGYSYCRNCGEEEADENRDAECVPEMVDFHQAVFDDPAMTPELKLYWLKVCADDYLAQMRAAARVTGILRGAIGVLEKCAAERPENLASDVPLVCGVALRATETKVGFEKRPESETQTAPNAAA